MDPLNRNGNASGTNYTPANPEDWDPQPANAATALDQLAAQTQGEVHDVTATAPLASSGGPTPNITIDPATDGSAGSMSAADKLKLDNLPASPVASVGATAPITTTGGANPTIGITAATDLAAGSMSAADKSKLDHLAAPTVPYSPTTPGDWSPAPSQVGAALDQLAHRPQGGGGSSYVFVYREGATPSGNVYATFAAAYAARQAVQGVATIEFDGSLSMGSGYMGTGPYDLTDTILTGRNLGVPYSNDTLFLGDALNNVAVITALPDIRYINFQGVAGATSPITVPGTTFNIQMLNSSFNPASSSVPLIAISGGGTINLTMTNSTMNGGGQPVILLTNSSSLNATLFDGSAIGYNALADDGTSSPSISLDLSSNYGTQPNLTPPPGYITLVSLDVYPANVFIYYAFPKNNLRANEFNTFLDAFNAITAFGPAQATILVSGNGAVLAGNYDLSTILLKGARGTGYDSLTFQDNVVINTGNGFLSVEGLNIYNGSSVTCPITLSGQFNLNLTDCFLYQATTQPLVTIPNNQTLYVTARGTSIRSQGAGFEPFLVNGTNASLNVSLSGFDPGGNINTFASNVVRGVSNFVYVTTDSLTTVSTTQTGLTGTLHTVLGSLASQTGYAPAVPANWSPAPTQAAAALDQLAARQLASAWADDGGNPVTFDTAGEIGATATITPTSTGLLRVTVTGSVLNQTGGGIFFYAGVSIGTGTIPFTYPPPPFGFQLDLPANGTGTVSFVVDLDRIATPVIAPVGTPFVVNVVGKTISGTATLTSTNNLQIAIQERAS